MIDNLPRVLAGPIVRRVDPKGCSFWIALSEPAQVTASIWPNDQMAGPTPGTVQSGETAVASSPAVPLRKFGDHLYVGLVTIPLDTDGLPPLSPGRIYSYDLVFSGSFEETGLRQEKLLQDEQSDSRLGGVDKESAPLHLALGYVENRLPSFVIPPPVISSGSNLHLAHASCRKTNGTGPDAMAWLDDELEDNYIKAGERIQQLFL